MKYIKMFEDNIYDSRCYWLLPTDDRFEDSLKQIKCPDFKIEQFLGNKNTRQYNYVFVGYNPTKTVDDDVSLCWGWNYKVNWNKNTEDFYEKKGYKFMGNINISDFEFDVNKFNI